MTPETWRLRRRLGMAVASGGLLLLAFPPVDAGLIALIALLPLFLSLRGATGRTGFICGLAAGAAFFGGLLYWIADFGFLAWGALTALMALSWALAGWFGAWLSGATLGRVIGVPFAFLGAELLRSRWPLGGFAWGLLGTTQHDGRPLLPLARVGGVLLVGLVAAVANAALGEAAATRRWWKRGAGVAVGALAIGLPALLPLGVAGPIVGRIEVAALQIMVEPDTFGINRGRRAGPEDLAILEGFAALTEAQSDDPPDVLIWPENALDRDPFRNAGVMSRVTRAVRTAGVPTIVGAILDAPDGRFTNSLLVFDPDGVVTQRYDKQRLVPFGEYVPWPALRRVIPALEQIPRDGAAADEAVILDVAGARIGGVICFESTFPDLVRTFVERGAQVIVVATNNASFGRSTASEEHLAQSQMRAAEQGRYVVHAGISGISAIIDPSGRILRRAEVFRRAVLRADVPLVNDRTPYGRYGDAIDLGLAVAAGLTVAGSFAAAMARRRDRRETRAAGEFDWDPVGPPQSGGVGEGS